MKNQFDFDYKDRSGLYKLLKQYKDDQFCEFSKKIIKPNLQMIGVRTPILRKIAVRISKNDPFSYLMYCSDTYFEEVLIHGLVLGYLDCDVDRLLKFVEEFIPRISDWAVCDMTASNLKNLKKYSVQSLDFVKRCLVNNNPWKVRFALVFLMDYHKKGDIKVALDLSEEVSKRKFKDDDSDYYVYMANGWLLSNCYIVEPSLTYSYLKEKIKDKNTKRAAIQKIVDSKRVSSQDKQKVKQLRCK